MTPQHMQRIAAHIADELAVGYDVLYDADEFHDPERTNADIRRIVESVVIDALTRAQAGEFDEEED